MARTLLSCPASSPPLLLNRFCEIVGGELRATLIEVWILPGRSRLNLLCKNLWTLSNRTLRGWREDFCEDCAMWQGRRFSAFHRYCLQAGSCQLVHWGVELGTWQYNSSFAFLLFLPWISWVDLVYVRSSSYLSPPPQDSRHRFLTEFRVQSSSTLRLPTVRKVRRGDLWARHFRQTLSRCRAPSSVG